MYICIMNINKTKQTSKQTKENSQNTGNSKTLLEFYKDYIPNLQ